MSPGNTSSSLHGKDAGDSTDGTEQLEDMGSAQRASVHAPKAHLPNLQATFQPTGAQDEVQSQIYDGANYSERAGENDSDVNFQNEQQTMSVVESMRFVTDLMKKLGIATIAKSLQRGHQYEILKQHPRALRTYESTHVDGAWILGDVNDNMADLTYAERLRHLDILGGQDIRKQGLAFHHSDSADGQTSAASLQVSNLHINVPSTPGMVVLAPPHSPDALFGAFRDPLMYNIRVSIIEFISHKTIALTSATASTSLHAISRAHPPSR